MIITTMIMVTITTITIMVMTTITMVMATTMIMIITIMATTVTSTITARADGAAQGQGRSDHRRGRRDRQGGGRGVKSAGGAHHQRSGGAGADPCARRHLRAGLARGVGRRRPHHGRLDGLVNAAGIAALGNIEETDFATWRKVISVNLDGTFLGCKHALALLKRRGGSIVNLSSVAGLIGGHNFAAYNASKGGVRLLTKSVALHGARLNPQVRCNSVHPAFLEGPMVDVILAQTDFPDAARSRMTRDIPLGRLGTPPRSRTCASICCRTSPASSPAPNSSSTAA